MKQVPVRLKNRGYSVTIGEGTLALLPQGLKRHLPSDRIVVLSNTRIANLFQSRIHKVLKKNFKVHWVLIPDGEKYKNIATVEKIYRRLSQLQVDRKTSLIALGGGIVGDIGGFVAATYLRGIPYIQIPTTLLAQVDSSVGGKTGVDLPSGKNLVGAFYQPSWVVIDSCFLSTLPKRELLCGIAEVVKYGILGDEKLFSILEKNVGKIVALKHNTLETVVARSVAIKARIVSLDEREAGLRSILNLGHTVGHAVEAAAKYRGIRHGEAVAMGIAYAALLSWRLGYCDQKTYERIVALLKAFGLPATIPHLSQRRLKQAIALDKKGDGSVVRYVVIRRIGRVECVPLSLRRITRFLPH